MSFWKETKKFFRAVNKKLVETSPISSVPPFDTVKDQPVRGFYAGMHDGEKWLHCHGRCEEAVEKRIKENPPE